MSPRERIRRFKNWLVPGHEDLGRMPFLWLIYLSFLFLPLFANAQWDWQWPTLATLPVFLVLYFRLYRRDRRRTLTALLPMALLSYVLTPFNPAAFTYLVYVGAAAPFVVRGLPRALLLTLAALAVQTAEVIYLRQSTPTLDLAIAFVICLMACVVNYFQSEAWRKNAALKASQQEIRRLAAVAERERIGRDLHDLLGHTLSLIALRSELAGKLIDRDRAAAALEIAGVTGIAREALRQVRTAVAGIRSATLTSELVSAQALLESSGTELSYRRDETALPAEIETALAMIVREATTNIQRHSEASRAHIEVSVSPEGHPGHPGHPAHPGSIGSVTLAITDNGCGGASAQGNGLRGIAERVRSLGGSSQLDSPRGHGTVLRAILPLASRATHDSVPQRVTTGESATSELAAISESAAAGDAAVESLSFGN